MLSPQSPRVLLFTTAVQHYLGAWKRLKKINNLCSTLNYFMSYFNFLKQIHLGIIVFVEQVHDNYINKKTSLCNQMVTNNSIPGQNFNGFPTI